jgi:hypothetical protein
MTPDTAKHRANIETGPTPNASKNLGSIAAEDIGPAVVNNHHMDLLRAIVVRFTARASDDVCVDRKSLTGGGFCQDLQHDGCILPTRNDAFHPHQRDMNPWGSCREPSISFVGNDCHRTGFSDRNVDTRDTGIGL